MAKRRAHESHPIPNLGWQRVQGPHHTAAYRVSHKVAKGIALAVIAVLSFVGTFAGVTWADISNTVSNQSVKMIVQKSNGKKVDILPVDPYSNTPINILLIGQDSRDGDTNSAIGGGDEVGVHNSDTLLVLQIAADRSFINLVSLPRDLMVSTPGCETSNGTMYAQSSVMINSIFPNAYAQGGDVASAASCTVNEVNYLSGLNIQQFMVVDFGGLVNMINAVGGVDVCIPTPMQDDYTGLNLAQGMQHLDGITATQYARTRHATGTDGSDTMRTTRQQYLIKRLIKTAFDKNMLTHSAQLYQLAKAGLESVQMSEGLANTTTLAGLAASMKSFDMSHLYSQTIPVVPWTQDANRSQFADGADAVWEKLRNAQPLVDSANTGTAINTNNSSDSDSSSSSDSKKKSTKKKSDSSSSSDSSSTDSTDSSSTDSSSTDSSTPTTNEDGSTYDPATNTTKLADGTIIDRETNGIIDPETGAIRSQTTGQFIGLAARYIEVTYCGVKY
ncbi:LCP family protein [Bifidobacterium sp. LC6]|uniref:LCP family protein n=1 Tax=Bifidobacterium colobi TaxID=2809026 RepID=A0ABS5UZ58_9BIFI|nr:LCP family protein [Bifidobacterium colobi]MBT1175786.1 LCP family protein [Bifidobacterium colobi]